MCFPGWFDEAAAEWSPDDTEDDDDSGDLSPFTAPDGPPLPGGHRAGTLSIKAAGGAATVRRVVNSKMGHAAARAVERAGFASEKEAREALRIFGQAIEKNGLPAGPVRDAAGHLVVPGFGQGGAVVYRQAGDKLTLQTVLTWIEGAGTPL